MMRVQIVGPIRIGLNRIKISNDIKVLAHNMCDYVGLVKCCVLNIVYIKAYRVHIYYAVL